MQSDRLFPTYLEARQAIRDRCVVRHNAQESGEKIASADGLELGVELDRMTCDRLVDRKRIGHT